MHPRLEEADTIGSSMCPYCAVGWTHHTTGVQMIRAAAIIQGLRGNVGRPGGGILALRGHVSIQGTSYNMLPTYLPQPNASSRSKP